MIEIILGLVFGILLGVGLSKALLFYDNYKLRTTAKEKILKQDLTFFVEKERHYNSEGKPIGATSQEEQKFKEEILNLPQTKKGILQIFRKNARV